MRYNNLAIVFFAAVGSVTGAVSGMRGVRKAETAVAAIGEKLLAGDIRKSKARDDEKEETASRTRKFKGVIARRAARRGYLTRSWSSKKSLTVDASPRGRRDDDESKTDEPSDDDRDHVTKLVRKAAELEATAASFYGADEYARIRRLRDRLDSLDPRHLLRDIHGRRRLAYHLLMATANVDRMDMVTAEDANELLAPPPPSADYDDDDDDDELSSSLSEERQLYKEVVFGPRVKSCLATEHACIALLEVILSTDFAMTAFLKLVIGEVSPGDANTLLRAMLPERALWERVWGERLNAATINAIAGMPAALLYPIVGTSRVRYGYGSAPRGEVAEARLSFILREVKEVAARK